FSPFRRMRVEQFEDIQALYDGRVNEAVPGWFYPTDMALIYLLMRVQAEQNITGDVCEVGVHLGKSAILLSRMRAGDENLYLYDIFDEPGRAVLKTADGSVFDEPERMATASANVRTFGRGEGVHFVQADTTALAPSAVRFERPLRFLHID